MFTIFGVLINATKKVDIKMATLRLQFHIARLAQSVEHETLNLRVVGSSPTLGEQFYFFSPQNISFPVKSYMFKSNYVTPCSNRRHGLVG